MVAITSQHESILNEAAKSGYQLRISNELVDKEWDRFIENHKEGHHTQSSLWSQLKASAGFEVIRIIIYCKGQIVAGGQILTKPFLCFGSIGYLPKGPVLAAEDQIIATLITTSILLILKDRHIRYLAVQPPDNGHAFESVLTSFGFRLSSIELAPTASVLIDLTQPIDEIQANFQRVLRYNIRYGQRKGIKTREGTDRDLPTFYKLLCKTAIRQNFKPESKEYYRNLWEIFGSKGLCKLFFAEYEGEVISGILLLNFSETVFYKRGCWSGRYPNLKPNDYLQWTAIQWAKNNGYKYYDFEGIEREIAAAVLRGDSLSAEKRATVSGFKMKFGGRPTLLPRAYWYINNPMLSALYGCICQKVENTIIPNLVRKKVLMR